jgi:hypothetical protein
VTIDDRIEALRQTVELLAHMHLDNEKAAAERDAEREKANAEREKANAEREKANAQKFAVLAEATTQLMDTVNRIGRILEIHENRLDQLENKR